MQEHVGKKRKKELREASALQREQSKKLYKCIGVFGGVIVAVIVIFALAFAGVLDFGNIFVQVVPTALIVASLFVAGSDVTRYTVLKKDFNKYCEEHSITKEDLAAYNAQ